jgi:hypothetical protein
MALHVESRHTKANQTGPEPRKQAIHLRNALAVLCAFNISQQPVSTSADSARFWGKPGLYTAGSMMPLTHSVPGLTGHLTAGYPQSDKPAVKEGLKAGRLRPITISKAQHTCVILRTCRQKKSIVLQRPTVWQTSRQLHCSTAIAYFAQVTTHDKQRQWRIAMRQSKRRTCLSRRQQGRHEEIKHTFLPKKQCGREEHAPYVSWLACWWLEPASNLTASHSHSRTGTENTYPQMVSNPV